MPRWSLQGIVIDSELDLGAPADPAAEAALTLDIAESARPVGPEPPAGAVLLERAVGGRRLHTAARDEARTVLRIHGLCDFVLTDGSDHVVCLPDPSLTREQLVLLVRGALLAFHLALTGECVLHASAVEVDGDGSAVVFVGGSGWGKSTMAAWLCSVGGRLIADDLLRLDGSRPPRWIGTGSEVRLRPTSASLATAAPPAWGTRTTADGRTALAPTPAVHSEGPLAAVILPARSRTVPRVQLERLDPVDAVLELVQFPRLDGWKAAEVIRVHFDALSRLAQSVPVYRASVPWGPPFRPRVALDLLKALGVPTASCLT